MWCTLGLNPCTHMQDHHVWLEWCKDLDLLSLISATVAAKLCVHASVAVLDLAGYSQLA